MRAGVGNLFVLYVVTENLRVGESGIREQADAPPADVLTSVASFVVAELHAAPRATRRFPGLSEATVVFHVCRF